ncbi:MAG TPA: universal stress protein [Polyangia bacterium]
MEIPARQTILVATDFSVRSDLALERAIGVAKQMDATLAIVHVVDPTAKFSLGTGYLDIGRTALSHMLPGSVAEKVVRHAPCPVLTVPFTNRAA